MKPDMELTEDERRMIVILYYKGYSPAKMGFFFNRLESTIKNYLTQKGLKV